MAAVIMGYVGVAPHRDPRGTEVRYGYCEVAIPIVPAGRSARKSGFRKGRLLGCRCLPPLELGSVDPDAVQDDGKFAGDRNARLLHAYALGQPHTPRLQP